MVLQMGKIDNTIEQNANMNFFLSATVLYNLYILYS